MDKVIAEDAEELASFDELESNFHKVVEELVGDGALNDFRAEYEKLHAALVESHESNRALIDQCKELNNTILANANKVSSVLTLSQNDQRVIAGLRNEFEKAWKMVEISQNKEQATKETVDALKCEVATLSRAVEQGSSAAATNEVSLEDINDSCVILKKEIYVQKQTEAKARNDIAMLTQAVANDRAYVDSLMTEDSATNVTIAADRATNLALAAEVGEATKGISKVKVEIKESQTARTAVEKMVSKMKTRNQELTDALFVEQRNMKSAADDVDENTQQVQVKRKVLANRKEKGQKILADMESKRRKIGDLDLVVSDLKKELDDGKAEYKESEELAAEMSALRAGLEDEGREMRRAMTECGLSIVKLTSMANQKAGHVRTAGLVADKKTAEERRVRAEQTREVSNTAVVADECRVVTSELMTMKGKAYEDRKHAVDVIGETDAYLERGITAKNGHARVTEAMVLREKENDELTMKLLKKRLQDEKQDALNETMRSQRDVAQRNLEESAKENEEAEGENEAITGVVVALKEDVRQIDQTCIELHVKQRKTMQMVSKLTKGVIRMQEKIDDMDAQATEARNKASRAMYLLSEADLDTKKQRCIVSHVAGSMKLVENTGIHKRIETDTLTEKARVLESLIKKGRTRYENLSKTVEESMDALRCEVARNEQLTQTSSHARALHLESIRIDLSLVKMRGKCVALEMEMEKPMNVHRWRFLEGTNPEMAHMIRMTTSLRDRLMTLITRLQKLGIKKKNVESLAMKQQGHLQKSYASDYTEEYRHLQGLLREKTRSLAQMESTASTQRIELSEHKGQVMNVRTMVREEKSTVAEEQKRVGQMRAKTALGARQRTVRPTTPRKQETRFIGGGFAVGTTKTGTPRKEDIRLVSGLGVGGGTTPGTPRKERQAQTRLGPRPDCVIPMKSPRCKNEEPTTGRRRLPSGWNPRRGPLDPFLEPASPF